VKIKNYKSLKMESVMLKANVLKAAFVVYLASLIFLFVLPSICTAQDPGLPDSMIVGNLNRTPILAGLNTQITVPVYLKTDDSIIFFHIPIASDNDFIVSRDSGNFIPPVTLWDSKNFLLPDQNSPTIGYTSQSILGFADLVPPDDPQYWLFTNYQWVHIADFKMTTTGDIAVLGDTTTLVAGRNPANGGLVLGDQTGINEIIPQTVWGQIFFPPNSPPVISSPDTGTFAINEQFGIYFDIRATDPDTDNMVLTVDFGPTDYTLQQIQNVPGSIFYHFTWVPGPGTAGTYPLSFIVNDGNGGVVHRDLTLIVTPTGLTISNAEALPGSAVSLPVLLDNQGRYSAVGAFDILVSYDPTSLTLNGVTRGGRLGTFEYFHITNDDAGPGTARITGIADIRNGQISPPLQPGTGPIFFLEFSVSSDEQLIGVDIPVRFLMHEDSDNTLSDSTGYLLIHPDRTNGVISVIGPGQVLVGDINLNGVPFEAGDVVLYVNHLTNPVLFPFDPIQVQASDVNADGIPETVADLVYLINIWNGEIERPKTEPISGNVILALQQDRDITTFKAISPVDLGAILVQITHQPGITLTPTKTGDFTIAYNDDGHVLSVLAYLPDNNVKVTAGTASLFTVNAKQNEITVTELSASDAAGRLINAVYNIVVPIPETFELAQNYPNPFNSTTQISFGLPQASDVRLDIYNLTGQKVGTIIDGHFEAGQYNVTWNGIDNAGQVVSSGVYFYKLNAGAEIKTMKMTLLK
jgi:hypothetical protein